ncbi:hypothetical protein Barb4_00245 [Bacteroidales bacterium Barb4]|nr:hypothetical protein Barb4_00245 [Bacteroidales bacterium Barb4]
MQTTNDGGLQYNIIIRSFFQNFLADIIFNPTFRFAACGAEIYSPFGTSA